MAKAQKAMRGKPIPRLEKGNSRATDKSQVLLVDLNKTGSCSFLIVGEGKISLLLVGRQTQLCIHSSEIRTVVHKNSFPPWQYKALAISRWLANKQSAVEKPKRKCVNHCSADKRSAVERGSKAWRRFRKTFYLRTMPRHCFAKAQL